MIPIQDELSLRVGKVMEALGLEGDPLIRVAQDEQFGDYQSNCAMGLAKKLGRKPRDVAASIVDKLQIDDLCEPPQIAGPGFINFRIKPGHLAERLKTIRPAPVPGRDRLGIDPADHPEVVVVDLSSPNLAKEMHVGHLRSTVIGDCVCRILEFFGHTVYRENHVGDWGTQFGMLVAHLRHVRPEVVNEPDKLEIQDLESFYVEAKERFDRDEEFRKESRQTVVALQSGDETTMRIWKAFCDESLRHCHKIYDRLGVRLLDRGESCYNDLMNEVIRRLEQGADADGNPLARESEGALCVFMDGFKTREGEWLPLIVRKSDGGFNYATSDLATLIHRIEELEATRIIYVVGLPQKQHFEMIFAATRKAGWAGDHIRLEHLGFGSVLDAAGRPFKTREGGTVKLKDLLDEAVARAREVVTQEDEHSKRDQSLSPKQIDEIAETVGLASIKYYDLSHNLNSDYRFDFKQMLDMEGNTAPYMLYAYARVKAIGRKAGVVFEELPADAPVVIEHPSELRLALTLARFPEALAVAARELRPNVLTDYLLELSKAFSRFYDRKLGVRVIDASPDEVRLSRLKLCDLTARTLKLGLGLLGIETLEQM
ncbi:MAG: arginine--tRNA ligase [Phycisphaerales bacterium]|nr:MAG: arginine--tRNA ligase [Phycisphaerales bacterium]